MSWRLALRLARREALRRPGRTALVVLLIAIPVCGMTLTAVLHRTETLTTAEEFDHYHGDQVDAVMYGAPDVSLPAGSETRDVRLANAYVGEPDERLTLAEAVDVPLDGPFQGSHRIVDGRAPGSAGEVALSRSLADKSGVGIGDRTVIRFAGPDAYFDPGAERPAEPQEVNVVGLVEDRSCLSCPVVSIHPDPALPDGYVTETHRLVILPDNLSDQELASLSLENSYVDPELRSPVADGDEALSAELMWSWVIGAVALTALGIVIAAAFAVGARRQLTTLGQLSATGASPKLLRRVLTLQGTVAGALGVAAGWVLTVVVLALGRGRLEQWGDNRQPAWELRPLDLAVVAVIGVAAATVAALLPARSVARIPTLAALAGRRPLSPVRHWVTTTGLATITVGLGLLALAILGSQGTQGEGSENNVWAIVAILGGILQLLGACAVTPALAGNLERLAGRLRGPWRLAARSLARQRTRTGAVAAAVAVCAALAIFAGGFLRGREAQNAETARYSLPTDVVLASAFARGLEADPIDEGRPHSSVPAPETVAEVAAVLDEPEQVPVRAAVQEGGTAGTWTLDVSHIYELPEGPQPTSPPWLADESLLEVLDVPDDVRRLVSSEGLVWAGWPMYDEELPEHVTVTAPDGTELQAAVVDAREIPSELGELLITPERARSLGLAEVDVALAFRADKPIGDDQYDELRLVEDLLAIEGQQVVLQVGSDGQAITPFQFEVLLGAIALAVTLFVVATSLALAAAESRDEREVLTVVGTRPRDLARSAGAKAGLLAGLGTTFAVPLGLAPVVVVAWTWSDGILIRPPWPVMGLLVVVVPVAVALAAALSSAVAQRVRPVRISTATFE